MSFTARDEGRRAATRPLSARLRRTAAACAVAGAAASGAAAQFATEGEVRQIVTFSFLPGRSADAVAIFRDRAIPLYERNEAMRSFRGFREVESPVPLDLIVVSSFHGMAGMDASNERLRDLAVESGTSIGAIYGAIGALSSGHTDEFVAMLPRLGTTDASSRRLTAFVRYRVAPGGAGEFEEALAATVVPWEREHDLESATGRFLVADGWDYLRLLAFESLAEYQAYWTRARAEGSLRRLDAVTAERSEIIVASVPALAVR